MKRVIGVNAFLRISPLSPTATCLKPRVPTGRRLRAPSALRSRRSGT
jgi:hypothetical protein